MSSAESKSTHLGRVAGGIGALLVVTTPLSWWLGGGWNVAAGVKLLLGLLLLGVFALTNLQSFVDALRGRSTPLLLIAIGSTLVGVVALALLNVYAASSPREWDWTREQLYTLAPQTRDLLRGLQQDVQVLAFYTDVDDGRLQAERRLERYATHAERLSFEIIDPYARPDLVERHQIREGGAPIVVLSGEREARAKDASEQELTAAIMRVAQQAQKTIAFTTGHGEPSLEAREPDGLQTAAAAIKAEGYDVSSLKLLDSAGADGTLRVPKDVATLLIVSPRGRFVEAEMAALENFLNGGGRLAVFLEPGHEPTGIETLLRQWKVAPRDDLVADRVSHMMGLGWSAPIVQPAQEHAITQPLVEPVVFVGARSLEVLAGGEARVDVQPLMNTGHSAWGETALVEGNPQLDAADIAGPITVATVAIREAQHEHTHDGAEHEGRMVVSGDADWITNQRLVQFGNLDLFLNIVDWLAAHEERISIRPRRRGASELGLTPAALARLKIASMDVLPVVLLALGAVVVLRRRGR